MRALPVMMGQSCRKLHGEAIAKPGTQHQLHCTSPTKCTDQQLRPKGVLHEDGCLASMQGDVAQSRTPMYIFIDIDGVMNSHAKAELESESELLDFPESQTQLANLQYIVEKTGAKIILSSTCRPTTATTDAVKDRLAAVGLSLGGSCPNLPGDHHQQQQDGHLPAVERGARAADLNPPHEILLRGVEILLWLDAEVPEHPYVPFVALDLTGLVGVRGCPLQPIQIVHTNHKFGLTRLNAESAVAKLHAQQSRYQPVTINKTIIEPTLALIGSLAATKPSAQLTLLNNPIADTGSSLDLLGLAFSRLPFRFIGIMAQVSRQWRVFAASTEWMRERVCFSFGKGATNGHGEDKAAPCLLEGISMMTDVQKVVCANRTTFFLCAGETFWLGQSWSRNIPDSRQCTPLKLPTGASIIHLACTVPGYYHGSDRNRYHVTAIGTDGGLYSWGQNEMGQLCPPSDKGTEEILEPELVSNTMLEGQQVTHTGCGVAFSMLLTESSSGQKLWMGGEFDARLGLMGGMGYRASGQIVPVREIQLPEDEIVASVHCGGFFAALLTENGLCIGRG